MILLALGTNQGNRQENLETALRELAQANIRAVHVSSVYETAALLPEGAPADWDIPYYNIVCTVESDLAPQALLAEAKRIEQAMGRRDIGRWGPRLIDIDIIAHGATVLEEDALCIPHRGMLERDFVLLPLEEIAPHWTHPTAGISAHEAVQKAGMAIGIGIMRTSVLLKRELP